MRPPLVAGQSSQDGLRYLALAAAAHLSRALLAVEAASASCSDLSGRQRPHAQPAAREASSESDPLFALLFPRPAVKLTSHVRHVETRIWFEPPKSRFARPSASQQHRCSSVGLPSASISVARMPSRLCQRQQCRLASTNAADLDEGEAAGLEGHDNATSSSAGAAELVSTGSRGKPTHRASPSKSDQTAAPEHWTAPIQPGQPLHESNPAFAPLLRSLDDLRRIPTEEAGYLREKLSDNLEGIWSEYRAVCHMEAMPLELRITVGRTVVSTMRRIKSQRQSRAKILTESNLEGRRLTSLVEDCALFRSRMAKNVKIPSAQRFAIANLEIQAKALFGQDIAALALLRVLTRTRADVLRSVLVDRVKLEDRLGRDAASDLAESMCAALDAMIARDSYSSRHISKRQTDPAGQLEPTLRMFPPENPAINADGTKATRSKQVELLDWLLYEPSRFALVSSKASILAGRRFSDFMSAVEDPVDMLEQVIGRKDVWSEFGPTTAATQVVLALLRANLNSAAIDVYRAATRRGARIDEGTTRYLLRMSAWREDSVTTESLIQLISSNMQRAASRGWRKERHLSPPTLATIALFRARHAHIEKMEQTLAELERREVDPDYTRTISRQARLESIIARGDLQGCRTEMGKRYDVDGVDLDNEPSRRPPPDKAYFYSLLRCCNNADDVENAVKCWDEMLQADVAPDVLMFNCLLELFARGTNVDSALQLVENLREWDVRPNVYTFTILVHLFALRKDTEGAIHAVKAMLAEGLEPNGVTWTALLNAYVESSSWDAAIGLFRWMQNNPERSLRPSVSTYNTLLKAYVRRAVPVQTVMSTAADMRSLGIEWNDYTFALVLQSASDAGLMDIAEEIFTQAEKRLPPPSGLKKGQGANLYHFTIMINGYLRQGSTEEAKEYFNELQDRGIEPSAITWSAIISSYTNSDSENNFHLARTLVTQLVKDEVLRGTQRPRWKSPALRQGPPYESMFMPLVVAQGRRGEPEEAEQTTDSLIETGSGLSLYALTALLDAYRRAGEADKAIQLFDTIYEQVLADTNIDLTRMYADPDASRERLQQSRDEARGEGFSLATAHNVDPARRSMLCMPISIMIQTLSAAGLHADIAELWGRAKRDGFAFDPHNWNNLAAAMARAGQLNEALTVIERVLNQPVPDYTGKRKESERFRARPAVSELDLEAKVVEAGATGGDGVQDGGDDEHSTRFSQEDDPLSTRGLFPSHLYNGDDMTPSPASPPNRRHEHRHRDDPFTPLPFESDEDAIRPLDDDSDILDSAVLEPPPPTTPRQLERESRRRAAAVQNMTKHLYDQREYELSLNPWFAHFETLRVVSEALDQLENSRRGDGRGEVARLLGKYKLAAQILARHRRKVEGIEEVRRLEAERSARDLIDRARR